MRRVEPRDATENGDGVASLEIVAETDVRDAVCRALVAADVGVLEVARLRDLETTFRALLEGDSE